jgi:kumamolisin
MGVVDGAVRMPDVSGRTIGAARIVRTTLTPAEWDAPMPFSVSLRMRDLAGLQARVAAGETIPFAELEARYLPLASDYARVADWLQAQGFTAVREDHAHLNFFARGTVAAVARTFAVAFARVATDTEYSSAVSAPLVPAALLGVVLSVNGLQPEFRLRHLKAAVRPIPQDEVGKVVFVTPDNVVSAYHIPAAFTGAGQTIAIISQAPPVLSDLTLFWSTTKVAQKVANLAVLTVNFDPPSGGDTGDAFETQIDVGWAGAIAPGAKLRDYVASDAFSGFSQILSDLPANPGLSVISSSYGGVETMSGLGETQAVSQTLAALAAQGVSILSASGDSGSNPDQTATTSQYSASSPLNVSFPASDPSVTGVGGTTIDYDADWNYLSEAVWNDLTGTPPSASGGGVSAIFPKPSWQVGGALLASQSGRCVPDVAAISDANLHLGATFNPSTLSGLGELIYQAGASESAVGTSVATPIWAAIAALVNQSRAAGGLVHIGLLNPHL